MITNTLPFIHYTAFLIYVYLTVFVVWKNPRALINWVYAGVPACLAIWSFAFIFIHDPGVSKDTAKFFMDIASVGWISFSSFLLWFLLVFTKNEKVLRTRIVYLVLFIVPAVFIYEQWAGHLLSDLSRQPYGWGNVWAWSLWTCLFFAYVISFGVAGLCLVFEFMRNTKNMSEKKSAKVIFCAGIMIFVLGPLTDMLFPVVGLQKIPNIANLVGLIWNSGIVYAVVKYRLLVLTPAIAAENIISTMADALILAGPDSVMLTVNQYACDLLGYKKEELIGKPFSSILPGKKSQVIVSDESVFEELIKKGVVRDHEIKYVTKKGKIIPVSFSGSVIRDGAGALAGIVTIARDITERKKVEESQKLTLLGRLASNMAHEVNNPLMVILGRAQLLLMKGVNEQYVVDALKIIIDHCRRAKKVIEGIVAFSKPIKNKIGKVDINQILSSVIDLVEFQLSLDNIKIIKHLSPSALFVEANEDEMRQVLMHLLNNAADAMPKGGSITISTVGASDGVQIDISDTGVGITEDNMEKLFEPFFTTKEKGTGLGLTVCYGIIRSYGGSINFTSVVGQGATVTVWLPAAD